MFCRQQAGKHVVALGNSSQRFILNLAIGLRTGGGDELANLSYRDRAADDLGHRDVTRNLSREL